MKSSPAKKNALAHPLLEQITALLSQTALDKWQMAGPDLHDKSRFERPRDIYEQVLVLDIPAASLVLHSVQRVSSTYLKGGYALIPQGPPAFTIELRDKVFNAERMIDPKYAANFKGKRCDIIATGEIAKSLFLETKSRIEDYRRRMNQDLEERILQVMRALEHEDVSAEAWNRSEASGDVIYSRDYEGIQVQVERKLLEFGHKYALLINQDRTSSTKNERLAHAIFDKLEAATQNSELQKLNDVLKGIMG